VSTGISPEKKVEEGREIALGHPVQPTQQMKDEKGLKETDLQGK